MAYVCLGCHSVFDEDEVESWYEKHGLDCGPYEHWTGSPCCRDNYVDAYECDCCGEYITTEEYVEIDDKKYCMDCASIRPLEKI